MKKYSKLLIIPCVIIIVSLYLIGTDVINRIDIVDDPSQKAAEVAHYLYGTESDGNSENNDSEQKSGNSAAESSNGDSDFDDNKSESQDKSKDSEPPELKAYSGKLNINTASEEELMTLDGIGEKYAERIIETREKLGGFKSIEQITKVKGIGQKRFEKIKDEITVGNADANN